MRFFALRGVCAGHDSRASEDAVPERLDTIDYRYESEEIPDRQVY